VTLVPDQQRAFGDIVLTDTPTGDDTDPFARLSQGEDVHLGPDVGSLLGELLTRGFRAVLAPRETFPDLIARAGEPALSHFRLPRFSEKKHARLLAEARPDPRAVLIEVVAGDAHTVTRATFAALGNRRAWLWQADELIGGTLAELAETLYPERSGPLALLVPRIGPRDTEPVAELIAREAADASPSRAARILAERLGIPRSRAYDLVQGRIEQRCETGPVRFHIQGHPALRATHHKTLELKRDPSLTAKETCVVGVGADFPPADLKKLAGRVRVTIGEARFCATICPRFDARDRIVFRKSGKQNAITLACHADKGAADLDRALIARLTDPETRVPVTIEPSDEDTPC